MGFNEPLKSVDNVSAACKKLAMSFLLLRCQVLVHHLAAAAVQGLHLAFQSIELRFLRFQLVVEALLGLLRPGHCWGEYMGIGVCTTCGSQNGS